MCLRIYTYLTVHIFIIIIIIITNVGHLGPVL
jgi:hypothetical protein